MCGSLMNRNNERSFFGTLSKKRFITPLFLKVISNRIIRAFSVFSHKVLCGSCVFLDVMIFCSERLKSLFVRTCLRQLLTLMTGMFYEIFLKFKPQETLFKPLKMKSMRDRKSVV